MALFSAKADFTASASEAISSSRRGAGGAALRLRSQPVFDRHKRLLAYAKTRDSELNLAQISAGWGKVELFRRPFQERARFQAAQRRAKKAGRGMWDACNGHFHTAKPAFRTRSSKRYAGAPESGRRSR
jgi:endonuclease YncB( thermonuclease family)